MNVVHGRPVRVFLASLLLVATAGLSAAAAAPRCKGERATKVGTAGDDEISGTKGRDVIVTLGGDDYVEGGGGADLICGGAGADSLYAGGGNDTVVGGGGDDNLIGDVGSDQLLGGGGNNYFDGGNGNDTMTGGKGFDYTDFRYGDGPVQVDLAAARATGAGTDKLTKMDMIGGTTGDDVLLGSQSGFELFIGWDGDDTIDGRGGVDQMVYDEAPAGISADLAAGTATGEGNDTLSSIESIVGSQFDDTLLGHEESDDLYGQAGNDTIDGRGGNDYLLGQTGDDDISGGPGVYDMIDFNPGAPPVTVNMSTGVSTGEGNDQVSGFEIIGGSEFDDTLIGDDGDNLFYSYAGDDSIDGGGGSDLVLYNVTSSPITADLSTGVATGEGQDSFANIEGIVGTEFNDTLTGDANDNVLIGGPGDDHLTGGNGNDYFEGGAGDDAIDGGLGTFDMANFYFAEGLTANLQQGTATGEGDDSMAGIEALLGSNSADVLTGDGGPNYIFGSGGADEISGAAGDDELDGGPGGDSLDGGPGTDSCLSGESVTACEGQTQSAQAAQAQSQQEALSTMGGVIGGTGEKRAH